MFVALVATVAVQTRVADTSPFLALPLPAAGRVRSASGAPGPEYWQQEAGYAGQATLDTAAQTVRGSELRHYGHPWRESREVVWMQVGRSVFAQNCITYARNQPPLEFAGGGG